MPKVVHLTSVHVPRDNRIFHKECRSAADAGYEVVLVAPYTQDQMVDGVRIRAVPSPRNRLGRIIGTVPAVARAAVDERADLYHFHDPELIPVGLLLRALGRKVVYDVHEDYITSVAQKDYLPQSVRRVLARLVGLLESMAAPFFELILAEDYYQRRFAGGTIVLNYPALERFGQIRATVDVQEGPRVLYTGGVTPERGALQHVDILHNVPDVEIFMVGRCSVEMAEGLRRRAGPHAQRLQIVGEGRFVPFEEIMQYYERGGWLAGLAIFPPTPHHREKELTKFFEYMAAGIPVVCSDFPRWKRLVEGKGVGLCVDSQSPDSVAEMISYLWNHPDDAMKMGARGRFAAQMFSWESESKKLLALYRRLLGQGGAVSARG